jgi:uncharacterized protein (DUF302 family)/RNA polymerase-binding transcription factor DksA
MHYTATTAKSVDAAANDLETAARKRGYGVLHSYDLRATLASKGVTLDKDVRVLEICNPQRAGQVLSADIHMSVALPCRVAIYESGSHTTIGMIRPGPLLTLLSSKPELAAVAADVEETLKAAIDEAAAMPAKNESDVIVSTNRKEPSREPLDRVAERRLRARDAELRADIDRELHKYRAERDGSAADNVPDSGELSAASLLAEVNLAEVDRDFSELLEVEAALKRVAAGTYGVCVDCGDAVEMRRLDKSPHAARCQPCQVAAERASGRQRSAKL